MAQLKLLTVPEPAQPDGIDLRLCSVMDLLDSLEEAPALIVADPPWSYSNDRSGMNGVAGNHYDTVTDAEIVAMLTRAHEVAAPSARLAMWITWPKLQNWTDALASAPTPWPWRYVTGGAWTKTRGPGIGYHWLGNSEPVYVFCKGSPHNDTSAVVSNAHSSPRTRHSEKPAEWMATWLERWTRPGDLVCDLFAGLAPLARACVEADRRYIGAELDPERYRQAVDLLAIGRGI